MSCGSSVPFVFEEYDHSFALINTHEELSTSSYYRPVKQGKIALHGKLEGTEIKDLYSFKNVSEKKYVYNPLSYDEQKGYQQEEFHLLVVPISYIDSASYGNPSKQQEALIRIQNSFFGSKEHNHYYSVSEFYQRSSYGHVKLTGEVTPFYEINKRASELENTISVVETIAADVIGYLHSKDGTPEAIDWSKYDNNNDDYVDGIYLVYDHPSEVTTQETDLLFWQVTDKISQGANGYTYKNNTEPYMCDFSWSSLDCAGLETISESNYYIHEMGHLFGLEDYYNTGTGYYQPTGFLDMMDYNLGDHTAFSKYLLNWTAPTVITDSCSLKLTPFHESGEFFLIPANPKRFNGEKSDHSDRNPTPFDEYLLLEFFAPNDLNDNQYFSNYRYTNKDKDTKIFTYPDIYGLKVYHVDARLAYYQNARFNEKVGFVYDELTPAQLENCKFVNYGYHNETSKYSKEDVPVLYHLLERSGNNTFIENNSGSNKTFFQPGDHFGSSVFKDFKFHDGSDLGFTFKYSKFSMSGITIDFYKK